MRMLAGLAVLLWLCSSTGCATTGKSFSQEVAGEAAQGALDQSLDVLDQPENRARLARILASPPMQQAVRDTSASLVAGVFDGVALAGDEGRLPGLPADLGASIGSSIERDLVPAAARLTHRTVDSALDAALAERHAARVEALVRRIGVAAASGLTESVEGEIGPALAKAIEQELGPALASTIEQDVLPAVGRGMQGPEVQQALVRSTASIGVGAALGAEQGLSRVGAGEGSGEGVQLFGRTVAVGLLIATVAAVAFAVGLVVVAVMLVRASRRQRQMYEDSRRREQLLLELFHSRVESAEHPVPTPEPTAS